MITRATRARQHLLAFNSGEVMKRNRINLAIDAVTASLLAGMIATGLLLRFVLPPGSGGRLTLWTWERHEWGNLHFYLALSMAAIVLLHLALHWQWVCATMLRCLPGCAQRPAPRRWNANLLGVVLALALGG